MILNKNTSLYRKEFLACYFKEPTSQTIYIILEFHNDLKEFHFLPYSFISSSHIRFVISRNNSTFVIRISITLGSSITLINNQANDRNLDKDCKMNYFSL